MKSVPLDHKIYCIEKDFNRRRFRRWSFRKIHLRLLQESKRYTLVGFYDPDVKASKDLKQKVLATLILKVKKP